MIEAVALVSNPESNDPIDRAILKRFSELHDGQSSPGEQEDFTPFDPVSKYSRAKIRNGSGAIYEFVKGAPQAISSLTGSEGYANPAFSSVLNSKVLEFAKKGFRALGVAGTDGDGKWQYLGVIGLFDPPRDDSAATIAEAKRLGIDFKMVTGDHTAIAREISGQVGLGKKIVPQSAFISWGGKDALSQLETADGFAEVFPENKFRIVKVLQQGDHIVGMTGDGVNDAPALREADSGIAVAGATDAAKSAADIVLTKTGLSVIIDAIGQSRAIFRRMENYAVSGWPRTYGF